MKGERLQPDGGAAPGGRPVGLVVRWAVSHQHPDEHDHRHRHSGRTPKPARLFHDDDRDDDTPPEIRYIVGRYSFRDVLHLLFFTVEERIRVLPQLLDTTLSTVAHLPTLPFCTARLKLFGAPGQNVPPVLR